MPDLTNLDRRFRIWESVIAAHSVRSRVNNDGLCEIKIIANGRSPAERLARNAVHEIWVQKYIVAHPKRLGFAKVDGPHDTGPDFRVQHRGKWHLAEAEVDWKRYLRHKHNNNPAFAAVRFLIVLSESMPSPRELAALPPKIVRINRAHFGEWFAKASTDYGREHQPGEKLTARVHLIAGAMQEHWIRLCPDADRQMATCPDCNSCPYFGNSTTGQALGFFQRLATDYAVAQCARPDAEPGKEFDLGKVSEAELRRIVEARGPF
jgi:hypothetical protein